MTGIERPILAIDLTDDAAVRARLGLAHVAVVGCGGLGSNAAMILVRSGVRTLTLIDFDLVERSNLNRQLFFPDQLGQPKPTALADTLRRIAPDLALTLHHGEANGDTVVALTEGADVVIEAVDGAHSKAAIARALLAARPDTALVAASGIGGAASANGVVTERVAESYYVVGDHESGVDMPGPILASRVVAAAAHQAHMAIRVLLGHPEP